MIETPLPIPQHDEDDLDIPSFLRRKQNSQLGADTMEENTQQPAEEAKPVEASAPDVPGSAEEKIGIEDCIKMLKDMTAKRNALDAAISAHKKNLQRLIGKM